MIDLWRGREPDATSRTFKLSGAISAQADRCELDHGGLAEDHSNVELWVQQLRTQLDEIEQSLIPFGMHVIGGSLLSSERAETIAAIAEAGGARDIDPSRLDKYLQSKDMGALKGLLAESQVPLMKSMNLRIGCLRLWKTWKLTTSYLHLSVHLMVTSSRPFQAVT